MPVAEPAGTALLFAAAGALMIVSVVFSRPSGQLGFPVAVLFLGVGMLAGSEGLGGLAFENYGLAFRWGTLALVLILFDGGLNTTTPSLRHGARPAVVLATLGVVGTAGIVAVGAAALGFPWGEALLLGAIVSSTDAAAVFAVLRGSGLHLQERVGATLELESGLNDPMAVSLTIALTERLVAQRGGALHVVGEALLQLVIGGVLGTAIGYGGRALLKRVRVSAGGLYPVFTIALALVAFAVPTLCGGSGFLGVYVAGVVLGNGPMVYRAGIVRVHDALAWLGQVTMFLLLGMLVFPSRLVPVAGRGLALALLLAFVARPVAVALCLLPFRYPPRQVAYVAWVGLRGAVPIILAMIPVLARAPGAARIFDLVFFVVVVNAVVPGTTVGWVTRKLKLDAYAPPPPPALLEITSTQPLAGGELLVFYIEPASAVAGAAIGQLPFPPEASALLVVRGQTLMAPKGPTVLAPGDHVFVFCQPADRPLIQLLFGRLA